MFNVITHEHLIEIVVEFGGPREAARRVSGTAGAQTALPDAARRAAGRQATPRAAQPPPPPARPASPPRPSQPPRGRAAVRAAVLEAVRPVVDAALRPAGPHDAAHAAALRVRVLVRVGFQRLREPLRAAGQRTGFHLRVR